jgi:hypothetical protein
MRTGRALDISAIFLFRPSAAKKSEGRLKMEPGGKLEKKKEKPETRRRNA